MARSTFYTDRVVNRDFTPAGSGYVPTWAIRDRLPSDARLAFDLFPSLKQLGDFMQVAWQFSRRLPADSRVSVSRVARACAKLVSSFKDLLPPAHSIITDLYLSEIQIELDKMNWWMKTHQRLASHYGVGDGGVVIELTPAGFSALSDIENWQVVENIIYATGTDKPFDSDHKLSELLSGIAFIAKRTK